MVQLICVMGWYWSAMGTRTCKNMRISVLIVVWCVAWISFECFSLSLPPHFFLPFLLYEPSPSFSYFVLTHLDNFWPYRTLFSWFFIINRDFWGLLYCLGVHLYNFYSYQTHLFWFFIMNRDFWGFLTV